MLVPSILNTESIVRWVDEKTISAEASTSLAEQLYPVRIPGAVGVFASATLESFLLGLSVIVSLAPAAIKWALESLSFEQSVTLSKRISDQYTFANIGQVGSRCGAMAAYAVKGTGAMLLSPEFGVRTYYDLIPKTSPIRTKTNGSWQWTSPGKLLHQHRIAAAVVLTGTALLAGVALAYNQQSLQIEQNSQSTEKTDAPKQLEEEPHILDQGVPNTVEEQTDDTNIGLDRLQDFYFPCQPDEAPKNKVIILIDDTQTVVLNKVTEVSKNALLWYWEKLKAAQTIDEYYNLAKGVFAFGAVTFVVVKNWQGIKQSFRQLSRQISQASAGGPI